MYIRPELIPPVTDATEALRKKYDMLRDIEIMKLRGIYNQDELLLAFRNANGLVEPLELRWDERDGSKKQSTKAHV